MKAYLFSIGEKTTALCSTLLEEFGFEVILIDEKESIIEKYKRFICRAKDEDCLKIDADVLPNIHIKNAFHGTPRNAVREFYAFDFYRNAVTNAGPTVYSKEAIKEIRKNLDKLDPTRPETSAVRLPKVQEHYTRDEIVVGCHGFFQSKEDYDRVIEQKKTRRQAFNFDLINKLINL